MNANLLLAALVLLAASSSAQKQITAEPKWTFEASGAFAWATDGHGALAVLNHTPAATELAVVTWIDASGKTLLTNIVADLGQNIAGSTVRIVRFSRTELTVQVQASYEYAPGTNFLRSFKRNGSFVDQILNIGESMDAIPSTLLDPRGFFTREAQPGGGFLFRRYPN